jgi:hypothetical protein
VHFVNITFAHTDAALDSCIGEGCCDQSGSNLPYGAIQGSDMRGVSFTGVEITGTGQYAMWVHAGSAGVILSGAYIHDLGAGGVRIGEPVR